MPSDTTIEQLNANPPAVIRSLKGRVVGFAPERQELRMAFDIGTEFCHTVDIVQGGFITAMLDASMAHAVLAMDGAHVRVSSIDINVSFLRPARAGGFTAVGSIVKAGRTVAFLRAELFNDRGDLVATATSSAHLTREHR
ncbi:MAG: PaaI family thioesterase [Burkholderiales bacterium]|nr:PaaI family thioesterase [Burkholderiales bacterium]